MNDWIRNTFIFNSKKCMLINLNFVIELNTLLVELLTFFGGSIFFLIKLTSSLC